jgi:hypothetical protein
MPAINDALVHLDEDGAVQPSLATSWNRISPTECEFQLREGVRFHNGESLPSSAIMSLAGTNGSARPKRTRMVLRLLRSIDQPSEAEVFAPPAAAPERSSVRLWTTSPNFSLTTAECDARPASGMPSSSSTAARMCAATSRGLLQLTYPRIHRVLGVVGASSRHTPASLACESASAARAATASRTEVVSCSDIEKSSSSAIAPHDSHTSAGAASDPWAYR